MVNTETVFWDFDGVIKDSVTVKSDAFKQLFLPFGEDIAAKVIEHHKVNGGVSRFDKLPIYLNWSGKTVTAELIDEYEEKFSKLVKQKVVDSEWIAGAIEYLNNNHTRQKFFLITATPQQEIEEILYALNIDIFFKAVIGSPTKKSNAIKQLLDEYNISSEQSIAIGDSLTDYEAAKANRVSFILRRTELNQDLQQYLNCKMMDNFL